MASTAGPNVSANSRKRFGQTIYRVASDGTEMSAAAFNDNQVRAAAGLTLVLGAVAFSYAWYMQDYRPVRLVTAYLVFDYAIRVVFGLGYSPIGMVAGWISHGRSPEWASAKTKRFAWAVALLMVLALMVIVNVGIEGWLPLTIGLAFLTLMWTEAVLGFCLGCYMHGILIRLGVLQKDAAFETCADGVCTIKP